MKGEKNVVVDKQRKSRSEKKAAGSVASIGIIFFLLDKLADVIYNALINGFFGRIFTAYSNELYAYEYGYVVSYFKGGSKTRQFFRKLREYLSRNFETSRILNQTRKTICGMAYLPMRTYGSFFLSFGIYTLLVYFIKSVLPVAGVAQTDTLVIGLCTCVLAIPLYASRTTLAKAVKNGRITRAIFIDCFGYRDEAFENKISSKPYKRSGRSILFGLLAGILTFIFKPLEILLFLIVFLLITLIVITPEIGILLCLFFLPFLSLLRSPTLILAVAVIVTVASYLIKAVRGKRIFKLELLDFVVALFVFMMYFSGAITAGGRPSYYSAVMSCLLMLGYFLIVNLIRTEKWLHRCVIAIISSGTLVAFIGIIQYVLGLSSNNWLDISYFPDIKGRTTSLFENPNFLAAYLSLVFPFALYKLFTCKTKKERLLSFFSCVAIVTCCILTWSRAAWLAMIISTLIFCITFSRKTVRAIFAMICAIPFLPFVLPNNVISRFASIGNLSDSSTLYRVYTWKGSLNMAKDYFWGGIGYGPEAFIQLYPIYAYEGIETAPHSHSLYIQILLSMGIGALICFAVLIFFYTQKTFEFLKDPSSRDSYLIAAASFVSTVALLIMGLFDYVWYNYRIFFMFWVTLAIGVACIRIGKKEKARQELCWNDDVNSASVDIEVNSKRS